jgi:phage shock protein A
VNELEQRKSDLRSRITALRQELQPHEQTVAKLRERIVNLENDLRDVFDQQREAERQARIAAESRKPRPLKEWVRTL